MFLYPSFVSCFFCFILLLRLFYHTFYQNKIQNKVRTKNRTTKQKIARKTAISIFSDYTISRTYFYPKKNLFLLFAVFCFFHTKTVQKNRHHAFCVLAKGIIPVADAPVINQRTFTERIRLYNFVHGNILSELALLLSLRHNLPQQLVIDSVMVEQVLFPRCNQL